MWIGFNHRIDLVYLLGLLVGCNWEIRLGECTLYLYHKHACCGILRAVLRLPVPRYWLLNNTFHLRKEWANCRGPSQSTESKLVDQRGQVSCSALMTVTVLCRYAIIRIRIRRINEVQNKFMNM